MVTNEQFVDAFLKIAEEMKALKIRVSELERKAAADKYVAKENTTQQTESNTDEVKSYPSVEDAPEWKLVFKVNTSEGISTQKVIQRAWTEKQAIFLGRSEQLFPSMNELVKAKQIQPKWNVAEVTAEKIV